MTQPRASVVISDYDPAWATHFLDFRAGLWPYVHDLATAFEHVGSTSVPGLAAKPIIDIDIVVPDEATAQRVISRLAPLGYRHRGFMGVPHRHAFFQPKDTPAHHLYVCIEGCLALRNHLSLRDHLRAHPAAAAEYAALKRSLAQRHPHDIDAYVEGKTPFILGVLASSGFDPEEQTEVVRVNQADAD